MAQGKSSRVVIEVDPGLKKELYVALAKRQLTMKDWFTDTAKRFLAGHAVKPNTAHRRGIRRK